MSKFNIKTSFKIVDKLTPSLKSVYKKCLENELGRELTDYEYEQILVFTEGFDPIKSDWSERANPSEDLKTAIESVNKLWKDSTPEEIKEDIYSAAGMKATQCGFTELTAQQAAYLLGYKRKKFSLKKLFKRWFKNG